MKNLKDYTTLRKLKTCCLKTFFYYLLELFLETHVLQETRDLKFVVSVESNKNITVLLFLFFNKFRETHVKLQETNLFKQAINNSKK